MIQKTRWSQYIRSHKKNLHSRDEKFFHGYIYITPMLLLWDLSTLYVVEHLLLLTLRSLFSLLSTIWIIWLFGSLVPAMHNFTSWSQVHELPRSHCSDNQESILFSWLHIYYTHLASLNFQNSMWCRFNYDPLQIVRWLVCWALFGWLVPAMCNHISLAQVDELPQRYCGENQQSTLFLWLHIYIMPILFLWDLSTLFVVDHLWPLTLRSLLSLLNTLWFIGTSNVYPYIVCPNAWVTTTIVMITGRTHCFHDYIYIMSLVHWYQQCVTVHYMPNCMSCHEAITVIARRSYCFHDYIYITSILCRQSLMTT